MKKIITALIGASAVFVLAGCTAGNVEDAGSVIGGDPVRVVAVKAQDGRVVDCATWRHSIDCNWEGAK